MTAPPATGSPAQPAGPLRRIVTRRVLASAGAAFSALALALVVVYTTQQQRAARQLLADAERHYAARTRQIDAEWVRQAELLRSQIEFSGVLDGDDARLAQARLTAFLTSMGGQGAFSHLLVVGRDGQVLHRYATRTQATLPAAAAPGLSWVFSAEDRLLYRVVSAPLRLGRQGVASLQLFAPVDNALLQASAFPNTALGLRWQGLDELAGSARDTDRPDPARDGWLRLGGGVDWAGEPGGPRLLVTREVQPVMPVGELLLAVLLGGLLAGALAWVVLGRWAADHVRRIGRFAGGLEQFAAGRVLTPALKTELDGAMDRASDELHALGAGIQSLMQGVAAAEQAQARAQDSLRELNATLERRVTERTQELARARDEALAASRAREQFLAAMSHELRTPLAGLLGGLELIDFNQLPDAERRMLGVARRSGDALRSVIDSVLDYAKLEAGHVALDEQVFRPDEVARDATSLFAAQALRRGLSLTCHCDPAAALPVRGDPVRLRQVLLNLVGNALKFTDRGRVDLHVGAAPGDGPSRLRFAVSDTGIGIDAPQQAALFQPFVQAGGGTTRGGTGLGLAISQRLVGAMGGRIAVRSEPGQGSTFEFELALPLADGPAPAPVSAREAALPALSGHALLVDDNAVNRVVAHAMLARLGLRVTECENGLQALEALRWGVHDVVLMDCQMPVLDGPSAARRIRAGEAGDEAARLPIIAITAHATDEDAARCLDAGMNQCVTKPFSMSALGEVLARWMLTAPRGTAGS